MGAWGIVVVLGLVRQHEIDASCILLSCATVPRDYGSSHLSIRKSPP